MTTTTKANGTTKASTKNAAHAGPGRMPASIAATHHEKPEEIALDRIAAAPYMNVRTEVREDGAEESRGYVGLVISIAADGQKTPVVIRPNPKYGQPGEREFLLVTGFTRYRAKGELASGKADTLLRSAGAGLFTEAQIASFHTEKPTITAIVRKLSDGDAAIENAADNMLTQSLNGADTAFGIVRAAAANPGMLHEKLAMRLGASQAYVTKVLGWADRTKNARVVLFEGGPELPLFTAWRQTAGKGHVTNRVIEAIAAEPDPKKQADLFMKAQSGVNIIKPKGPSESNKGPGAWLKNAEAKATKLGWTFHDLVELGAIETSAMDWTAEALIALMGPLGEMKEGKRRDASAAQLRGLVETFVEALTNGRPDEDEDEEDEEEAPAPKARGKKGGK